MTKVGSCSSERACADLWRDLSSDPLAVDSPAVDSVFGEASMPAPVDGDSTPFLTQPSKHDFSRTSFSGPGDHETAVEVTGMDAPFSNRRISPLRSLPRGQKRLEPKQARAGLDFQKLEALEERKLKRLRVSGFQQLDGGSQVLLLAVRSRAVHSGQKSALLGDLQTKAKRRKARGLHVRVRVPSCRSSPSPRESQIRESSYSSSPSSSPLSAVSLASSSSSPSSSSSSLSSFSPSSWFSPSHCFLRRSRQRDHSEDHREKEGLAASRQPRHPACRARAQREPASGAGASAAPDPLGAKLEYFPLVASSSPLPSLPPESTLKPGAFREQAPEGDSGESPLWRSRPVTRDSARPSHTADETKYAERNPMGRRTSPRCSSNEEGWSLCGRASDPRGDEQTTLAGSRSSSGASLSFRHGQAHSADSGKPRQKASKESPSAVYSSASTPASPSLSLKDAREDCRASEEGRERVDDPCGRPFADSTPQHPRCHDTSTGGGRSRVAASARHHPSVCASSPLSPRTSSAGSLTLQASCGSENEFEAGGAERLHSRSEQRGRAKTYSQSEETRLRGQEAEGSQEDARAERDEDALLLSFLFIDAPSPSRPSRLRSPTGGGRGAGLSARLSCLSRSPKCEHGVTLPESQRQHKTPPQPEAAGLYGASAFSASDEVLRRDCSMGKLSEEEIKTPLSLQSVEAAVALRTHKEGRAAAETHIPPRELCKGENQWITEQCTDASDKRPRDLSSTQTEQQGGSTDSFFASAAESETSSSSFYACVYPLPYSAMSSASPLSPVSSDASLTHALPSVSSLSLLPFALPSAVEFLHSHRDLHSARRRRRREEEASSARSPPSRLPQNPQRDTKRARGDLACSSSSSSASRASASTASSASLAASSPPSSASSADSAAPSAQAFAPSANSPQPPEAASAGRGSAAPSAAAARKHPRRATEAARREAHTASRGGGGDAGEPFRQSPATRPQVWKGLGWLNAAARSDATFPASSPSVAAHAAPSWAFQSSPGAASSAPRSGRASLCRVASSAGGDDDLEGAHAAADFQVQRTASLSLCGQERLRAVSSSSRSSAALACAVPEAPSGSASAFFAASAAAPVPASASGDASPPPAQGRMARPPSPAPRSSCGRQGGDASQQAPVPDSTLSFHVSPPPGACVLVPAVAAPSSIYSPALPSHAQLESAATPAAPASQQPILAGSPVRSGVASRAQASSLNPCIEGLRQHDASRPFAPWSHPAASAFFCASPPPSPAPEAPRARDRDWQSTLCSTYTALRLLSPRTLRSLLHCLVSPAGPGSHAPADGDRLRGEANQQMDSQSQRAAEGAARNGAKPTAHAAREPPADAWPVRGIAAFGSSAEAPGASGGEAAAASAGRKEEREREKASQKGAAGLTQCTALGKAAFLSPGAGRRLDCVVGTRSQPSEGTRVCFSSRFSSLSPSLSGSLHGLASASPLLARERSSSAPVASPLTSFAFSAGAASELSSSSSGGSLPSTPSPPDGRVCALRCPSAAEKGNAVEKGLAAPPDAPGACAGLQTPHLGLPPAHLDGDRRVGFPFSSSPMRPDAAAMPCRADDERACEMKLEAFSSEGSKRNLEFSADEGDFSAGERQPHQRSGSAQRDEKAAVAGKAERERVGRSGAGECANDAREGGAACVNAEVPERERGGALLLRSEDESQAEAVTGKQRQHGNDSGDSPGGEREKGEMQSLGTGGKADRDPGARGEDGLGASTRRHEENRQEAGAGPMSIAVKRDTGKGAGGDEKTILQNCQPLLLFLLQQAQKEMRAQRDRHRHPVSNAELSAKSQRSQYCLSGTTEIAAPAAASLLPSLSPDVASSISSSLAPSLSASLLPLPSSAPSRLLDSPPGAAIPPPATSSVQASAVHLLSPSGAPAAPPCPVLSSYIRGPGELEASGTALASRRRLALLSDQRRPCWSLAPAAAPAPSLSAALAPSARLGSQPASLACAPPLSSLATLCSGLQPQLPVPAAVPSPLLPFASPGYLWGSHRLFRPPGVGSPLPVPSAAGFAPSACQLPSQALSPSCLSAFAASAAYPPGSLESPPSLASLAAVPRAFPAYSATAASAFTSLASTFTPSLAGLPEACAPHFLNAPLAGTRRLQVCAHPRSGGRKRDVYRRSKVEPPEAAPQTDGLAGRSDSEPPRAVSPSAPLGSVASASACSPPLTQLSPSCHFRPSPLGAPDAAALRVLPASSVSSCEVSYLSYSSFSSADAAGQFRAAWSLLPPPPGALAEASTASSASRPSPSCVGAPSPPLGASPSYASPSSAPLRGSMAAFAVPPMLQTPLASAPAALQAFSAPLAPVSFCLPSPSLQSSAGASLASRVAPLPASRSSHPAVSRGSAPSPQSPASSRFTSTAPSSASTPEASPCLFSSASPSVRGGAANPALRGAVRDASPALLEQSALRKRGRRRKERQALSPSACVQAGDQACLAEGALTQVKLAKTAEDAGAGEEDLVPGAGSAARSLLKSGEVSPHLLPSSLHAQGASAGGRRDPETQTTSSFSEASSLFAFAFSSQLFSSSRSQLPRESPSAVAGAEPLKALAPHKPGAAACSHVPRIGFPPPPPLVHSSYSTSLSESVSVAPRGSSQAAASSAASSAAVDALAPSACEAASRLRLLPPFMGSHGSSLSPALSFSSASSSSPSLAPSSPASLASSQGDFAAVSLALETLISDATPETRAQSASAVAASDAAPASAATLSWGAQAPGACGDFPLSAGCSNGERRQQARQEAAHAAQDAQAATASSTASFDSLSRASSSARRARAGVVRGLSPRLGAVAPPRDGSSPWRSLAAASGRLAAPAPPAATGSRAAERRAGAGRVDGREPPWATQLREGSGERDTDAGGVRRRSACARMCRDTRQRGWAKRRACRGCVARGRCAG
ncbi:hypothetical protein BESB_011350 [Besnoitia besnoiti]|uniref:Uncharacterized protein n=1 Tax=Besnoitia besnoiti TaxID=94643 RepID=A0A2A9MQW1_BESBE|nr:hypothetical protein BESB_011350 [Besnoitia besnoiti]PFH38793.1 hypothetical protein BESB_011350 [Besnoitia besnoiti]